MCLLIVSFGKLKIVFLSSFSSRKNKGKGALMSVTSANACCSLELTEFISQLYEFCMGNKNVTVSPLEWRFRAGNLLSWMIV